MQHLTLPQKRSIEKYVLNLILNKEIKVQQHIICKVEEKILVNEDHDLTEIEYPETHKGPRPPFAVKVTGNPYSASPGFNISVIVTGWGLKETEDSLIPGLVEVEKFLSVPYEVIEEKVEEAA